MNTHIQIHFLAAAPDMRVVGKAPFRAKYPLLCSKNKPEYYQGTQCAAIVQEHDAIDAYILTVEVRTEIPLRIPVTTGMPDLYWLYQPIGESRILLETTTELKVSELLPNHCLQLYSQPCRATWEISSEKLFLQLHIIKGKWTSRYVHQQNRPLELLIRCKKEKRLCTLQTPDEEIADEMNKFLTQVRLVSGSESMGLDGDLQKPISHLADWHRMSSQREPTIVINKSAKKDQQWTKEVQWKIREWLRLDIPIIPTVNHILKKFGVNRRYIWIHYQKNLENKNETLIQFIQRARLEEGKRLMDEERFTPDEVVDHLHYTDYSAFSNPFTKMYGLSPLKYFKSLDN